MQPRNLKDKMLKMLSDSFVVNLKEWFIFTGYSNLQWIHLLTFWSTNLYYLPKHVEGQVTGKQKNTNKY